MPTPESIDKGTLSSVTHHVRNPFNGLIGFSDLLVSHFDKLSERDKVAYSMLLYNISRQAFLRLENMIWWLKLISGNIQMINRDVYLKDCVENAVNFYKEELNSKPIHISYANVENIVINTDSFAFETILKNLISNAINACPVGGRIDISLLHPSDFFSLRIQDSGHGIQQEEIRSHFASGQGSESALNPGFGMWVSEQLCRQCGFQLELITTSESGTVFAVNI